MRREDVAEVLNRPISRELLESSIPARLSYIGVDGAPRVIPIAFLWHRERLVMATAPTSPKARALRRNPRVALTIDTQDRWPPHALLIRGSASTEVVDEIPDAYIEASRKLIPPADFATWEQGVRDLYDGMTVITVVPDWAKLLDFETTVPQAVEDLVAGRH
ncbi:pyridoxamine 5'-phosphate oxidase family protein [Agromyces bauzanensis]|uniref:Pyridoxamine 5'-phosphate oxidase n=1 Tax=Agromyces bauzanensis TaxID=1308924 RepID=A0A917UWC2_9MICO|nr:pyridoxamine 5'-phosphate oxidase family protein [Agromyces bauzanensis]GGJ89514.1 pyridoxamine 5'-phosphate oxidase [Agromyces bauzanensis]